MKTFESYKFITINNIKYCIIDDTHCSPINDSDDIVNIAQFNWDNIKNINYSNE